MFVLISITSLSGYAKGLSCTNYGISLDLVIRRRDARSHKVKLFSSLCSDAPYAGEAEQRQAQQLTQGIACAKIGAHIFRRKTPSWKRVTHGLIISTNRAQR